MPPARTLTHRGRTLTVVEWARELGITRQALEQRLRRAAQDGTPLEAELERGRAPRPSKPRSDRGKRRGPQRNPHGPLGPQLASRVLVHDGRRQTVRAWARELGLSVSTILERLHVRGWTTERTLSTPPRTLEERTLTHDGRTQSFAAWARELDLSLNGLRGRLERWGVERALSTPRQPQGRRRR